MSRLLPLPVAVPLVGAAVATVFRGRLGFQRVVGFGASLTVLGYGIALVAVTSGGRVLATQVGGFPPGFAIALAGDLFSALMLVVGALMIVVSTTFAVAREEDHRPFFHPLVLVLAAGISGAFLTADLFNLFVFFEVMLIASYVLLTLGRDREVVRAGAVYVTTNLLASTLLVAGVALAYGLVGTVNLAELREAVRATPTVAVAGALLLVAFAVKASLVPVHGWLPRAYPETSPAVAAMFSGLLTKVGVYALYRVYAVMFGGDPAWRMVLLVIASASMVVGVLGAVGRERMREILSFHIVSQIGYMIMGLGLFGPLGLAGGIFYVLHHIVVKTSLFLSAGAVETIRGTGVLGRLGGLARAHPVLAAGFIVSALSLGGLPPLSGFFAKLALVRASFQTADYGIAAVSIVVSLLTVVSMVKIWNAVFWGEAKRPISEGVPAGTVAVAAAGDPEPTGDGSPGIGIAGVVGPAVFLAVISVVLGLWADGLFTLTVRAAEGLVDPSAYVTAVLGR